jgi:hypothetical protein
MDVGEDVGFFVVAIAVPWLVAWLVWQFGTWAKVLGILASLASGFLLFWTVFGLQAPASPADFVLGVMLPLGVLLGLLGSIAAIVAQRRGHLDPQARRGERKIVGAAVGLVVLATVVAGTLTLTGRTSVDEGAAAGAVSLRVGGRGRGPGKDVTTPRSRSSSVAPSSRPTRRATPTRRGWRGAVTCSSRTTRTSCSGRRTSRWSSRGATRDCSTSVTRPTRSGTARRAHRRLGCSRRDRTARAPV